MQYRQCTCRDTVRCHNQRLTALTIAKAEKELARLAEAVYVEGSRVPPVVAEQYAHRTFPRARLRAPLSTTGPASTLTRNQAAKRAESLFGP